jgi:hypothetical protein
MILMSATEKNRSSVSEYRQNLETIFSSIHAPTLAQIIFALPTPVLKERQRQGIAYGRVVRRDTPRSPAKSQNVSRFRSTTLIKLRSKVIRTRTSGKTTCTSTTRDPAFWAKR